jgi:beta-phosphoglucomutase-like phosphatase (HAD superfamily)
VTDTAALQRILTGARAILLDFDGPICDVFAAYPAHVIADELCRELRDEGVELPLDQVITGDPLDLIEWVAEHAPDHFPRTEAGLIAREVEAATNATPTPGSTLLMESCAARGLPVAVVSNNAAQAVAAYLDKQGLSHLVQHVQGRDPDDPRLMKPNPHPIIAVLAALGRAPAETLLIGDSASDVVAGRAAGVPVIAYANKPGKDRLLADADAMTTQIEPLARLLNPK